MVGLLKSKGKIATDASSSGWDEHDTMIATKFSKWYEEQGSEKHDLPPSLKELMIGAVKSGSKS